MRDFLINLLVLMLFYGFFSVQVSAQRNSVWVFGTRAGIDFNSGSPVPVQTSIDGFGEGCASVCDENGQLLFFTEGSKVWDKNGSLMNNGTNLTPVVSTNIFSPTSSTCQGALIVPFVKDKHRYFIFSLISFEQIGHYGELYYSIVDMRLNNGKGEVVSGQKGILMDDSLTEQMTAVVGDRCNVWLLVCSRKPEHKIKAYDISEKGINPVPVVSNGFPSYLEHYAFGTCATAPDRKRIAIAKATNGGGGIDGLGLFDFDPVNGSASNYQQLSPAETGYGVCFSADGQKLYFDSYVSGVCQYDLSFKDINQIISSKISLSPSAGMARGFLKSGPDDKIYFRGIGANGAISGGALSRISYPNNIGNACVLEENVISLIQGTSAYLGLPAEVPVLLKDTFYTSQTISAECFANVNSLAIQAIDDSSGWDYQWSTGATIPRLKVDTHGIYWVTYRTPPCDFHVDTFRVNFPNGVLPDITSVASCFNATNGKAYASTYVGDTVQYYYLWQNQSGIMLSNTDTLSKVPSGTYRLQVTTANCDTSFSFYIPEAEHRAAFLMDSMVCMGNEVIFENHSDGHFRQFHWDFGDAGNSLLENPTHIYDKSGSYKVNLVGIGDICTDSANATITVDPRFSGTFLTAPDSICMGEAVVFSPQLNSSTLNELNWEFGDGTAMTSGDERQMRHAYDISGVLPVTLISRFRVCPDTSFTEEIYVAHLPKVDLGFDNSLCGSGDPLVLYNRNNDVQRGNRYQWNTQDTTEELKVVDPGRYSLTIREEVLGCSSTDDIMILKDCYIDIPNAFTPDGDGYNDYFFPRQLLGKGVTKFQMQVFNRWGQIVFETDNRDGKGWDGRFGSKEQSGGVYIYTINIELEYGKREHYEGNVTLIR